MKQTKPSGYWKDINNVILEAEFVKSEHDLDRLPSRANLIKMEYNSLSNAISKYHGGLENLRQMLGEKSKRKPKDYWKDVKNVIAEARKVMEENELDRLPSQQKLCDLGYSSLPSMSVRYHGGLHKIREILGQSQIVREHKYWQDWDNVERELKEIIRKVGHFPTHKELQKGGNSSLSSAIHSYHNGLNTVRKKMGHKISKRSFDYWKDWSNLERELQEVIDQLGHFPKCEELQKGGNSSILSAISSYYGGLCGVRRRMGYESLEKPKNYWKDWSNVERELQEVIDQLGHFPTQKELQKGGNSSLSSAIYRHHSGLNAVLQRMGQPSERQQLESLLENYVREEAA